MTIHSAHVHVNICVHCVHFSFTHTTNYIPRMQACVTTATMRSPTPTHATRICGMLSLEVRKIKSTEKDKSKPLETINRKNNTSGGVGGH